MVAVLACRESLIHSLSHRAWGRPRLLRKHESDPFYACLIFVCLRFTFPPELTHHCLYLVISSISYLVFTCYLLIIKESSNMISIPLCLHIPTSGLTGRRAAFSSFFPVVCGME